MLHALSIGVRERRVSGTAPESVSDELAADVLLETIKEVLAENKLVMDEASSRLSEGIIVTQPYVFGRGPVIASSELKRYGIIEFADTAWSRGQYSLTIEVQSIDGIKNNVSVNAKIEGRSGRGLTTEW